MTHKRRASHCVAALLSCSLSAALGCDEGAKTKGQPSATASSQRSRCDVPARYGDPTNLKYLPRQIHGFCLDPTGSDRAYGEGARQPLDGICDLFDGECELYKDYNVKRVVEARYVDGAGTDATIDLYLSTYSSPEMAYGMFTKRVVGDRDPAHPDTAKAIAGGGAAALGIGSAYLWRGAMLAEIAFVDDSKSTKALTARADAVLPPLVKQLGAELPGQTKLPAAAAALPTEHLLPLGIRYVPGDLLRIANAGPGAIGYYRQGDKRWRELAATCGDEQRARDVLQAFAKSPGATPEKDLGDGAVRLMNQPHQGAVSAEWLVGRRAELVRGIGDERTVLRAGMTAAQVKRIRLDQSEKRERLRLLLTPKAPASKAKQPPAPKQK